MSRFCSNFKETQMFTEFGVVIFEAAYWQRKKKFTNISKKLCCGNDNISFLDFSKSNTSQSQQAYFIDTGISIVIYSRSDPRQIHCYGVSTSQW